MLKGLDVFQRVHRREILAVGCAKGIGKALGQRARFWSGPCRVQRIAQVVSPGAHDGRDPGFKRGAIDARRLALVATNDVVRARQRPVRIGGIGRRQAALIDARKKFTDTAAHGGVVPVLRDEHENRDEPVKLVDTGQSADAGSLGQLQDVDSKALQHVGIDLEQLIARIGIEHVHQ